MKRRRENLGNRPRSRVFSVHFQILKVASGPGLEQEVIRDEGLEEVDALVDLEGRE